METMFGPYRLEARLGVRLLHRTTRSVAPTDAGARLLERLEPALGEVRAALDVVNNLRDRPAGRLRLNVPVSAARLVLPQIVPPFLALYPDITLEVIAEDRFVYVLAEGCDAGIRDLPPRAVPFITRKSGVARLVDLGRC